MPDMDDELKAHYRQGLHARIEALESARQALPEMAPEAVERVKRTAHSLRGSGATYGFPKISETAEALENSTEKDFPGALGKLIEVLRETVSEGQKSKTTVLIVEDDPDITHLFQARLSDPARKILFVETAEQAQKILRQESISLILLDLVLPDMDGRRFLEILREQPHTAGIPVFVVSGGLGKQTREECLALGAEAYFEKPFDPAVISNAISAKLLEATGSAQEPCQDPLTGLPNRAALKNAFPDMLEKTARARQPLSFAIIDIDHYESIKNAYGRSAVETVLKKAAAAIGESLRSEDFVARWGEQEFSVLFPNLSREEAAQSLDTALKLLRSKQFRLKDGRTFRVGFSAGVTDVTGERPLEEVVAEAGGYVYQAKTSGRNRVVFAKGPEETINKKILLAEDDDLIASIIVHRLKREGFEVIHVPDGVSALKAAKESPYSMIIADVKMPAMDGFELLTELRRDSSFNSVPIVMLTAMGSEKDIQRGFDLGADDYIPKPFSPIELLARLRRLLKRQ
ncbi:MAG TPA: response regulator [bacterium]|mgnify:CR=1 FL=1|nr:response regulator [bacterium]